MSDLEALQDRIGQLERHQEIDSQIADRVPRGSGGGDKYARREYLFLLATIFGACMAVLVSLIINNGLSTADLERRHDAELRILAQDHAEDRARIAKETAEDQKRVSNWMAFTGFYSVSTCKTMRGIAMSMQPGVQIPDCMTPSDFPPLD